MLLVIALAIAVGIGAAKVFGQGGNAQIAVESGAQLDAALGGTPDHTDGERWYEHSVTIGLMAGGATLVLGIVAAAAGRPATPEPR